MFLTIFHCKATNIRFICISRYSSKHFNAKTTSFSLPVSTREVFCHTCTCTCTIFYVFQAQMRVPFPCDSIYYTVNCSSRDIHVKRASREFQVKFHVKSTRHSHEIRVKWNSRDIFHVISRKISREFQVKIHRIFTQS